jgi:parallel beta-helix repeat protein
VIGEGRNITIIDANSTSEAVVILQDYVVLRGFNIIGKNYCIYVTGDTGHITISDNNLSEDNYNGVEFDFYGENKYNIIENNVFYSDSCGVCIQGFSDDGYNIIRNNTFVDNWDGVYIGGTQNEIVNNKFLNCRDKGVCLYGEKSLIENNLFIGNDMGVDIDNVYDLWHSQNRIIGNHFEKNEIGLRLKKAYNTIVTQNNFVQNKKHATFYEESRSHGNNWDGNYWSRSFSLFEYKFIFGRIKTHIQGISFDPENPSYYYMRWINFDRNPAKEPYDI